MNWKLDPNNYGYEMYHRARCLAKRGYPTKKIAKKIANNHQSRSVRSYRCPYCSLFHLTTKKTHR